MALMSLSKGTYRSVFCAVYRFRQVPPRHKHTFGSKAEFQAFAAWVESKPSTLLHTAVQALRINLDEAGHEPTIWLRLFQKLAGLTMLRVFCSHWPEAGGCLPVVWDALFRLPGLKRLHLDWYMNPLALPPPDESPLYALRHLTHLTIVPHNHSIQLEFLQRFEALIYLVIFNPALGYTRESVVCFEAGLPRLRILLLVFTRSGYDKDRWLFDQSDKVVALHRVYHSDNQDEFEKELNGENTIWKEGENALAERLGI